MGRANGRTGAQGTVGLLRIEQDIRGCSLAAYGTEYECHSRKLLAQYGPFAKRLILRRSGKTTGVLPAGNDLEFFFIAISELPRYLR